MKSFLSEIKIATENQFDLINITNRVEEYLRKSNIKQGLCLIHSLHSTTAIIINENETGLKQDILSWVKKNFPRGAGWLHDKIDDNAYAHLASTFIGPSKTLPIKDGKVVRGTWQDIFLLELDGPRNRNVIVEIIGE